MRALLALTLMIAPLGCLPDPTGDLVVDDTSGGGESGGGTGEDDTACEPLRWWPDADSDGYGADGPSQEACEEPDGHVTNNGDCDDTDDETHPGATDLCGDDFDQDCSGTPATCGWEGEHAIESVAPMRFDSTAMDSGFGFGLARLSSPPDSPARVAISGSQVEAVFVFMASENESQTDSEALELYQPEETGTRFGRSVAGLGDAPGLVVGAPDAEEGMGAIYFFGAADPGSITTDDAAATLMGDSDQQGLGTHAVFLGDAVGDDDVHVLVSGSSFAEGNVAVLLPTTITGERDISGLSERWQANEEDGESMSLAAPGDLDGDGLADAILAFPTATNTTYDGAGRIVTVLGPGIGSTSIDDGDGEQWGNGHSALFGSAVAPVGDTSGDGYPEVAVSVFGYQEVRVYQYIPDTGSFDFMAIFTGSAEEWYGAGLEGGSDIDGDGVNELLVASPGADSETGLVRAYRAPFDGTMDPVEDAVATFTGPDVGARLGIIMESIGDIDGDGGDEVLFSAMSHLNDADGQGSVYLLPSAMP